MADFKFEIVEKIGVLSEKPNGWRKELNFVKWGEYPPKFDIREWSPEYDKMGKGLTFTSEELEELGELIKNALE